MTRQPERLGRGGRIDRSRTISFRFDGVRYEGHPGDTLASALLANGENLVGRSFKFHRPRGIVTAGPEEPSALVTLREGARREPNVPVTMAELYDGLVCRSQNRWPSLNFDVMAVNDLFKPVFSAGFYYKTFMGPTKKAWMWFEPFIRRAAGLGAAATEPDPDRYEKLTLFCDVLVAGSGPAGLAAALAAGRAGARVILADERHALGGALLDEPVESDADEWLTAVLGELSSLPNVRLLPRTTVFGAYDHGTWGLVERVADHKPAPDPFEPRQRFIVVQARQAVVAAGAIERPIPFGNNDRPGVMLASAVRSYLNRYAVLAGRKAIVFTNNDSAYRVAVELSLADVHVTVVDPRPQPPASFGQRCKAAGIEVVKGHVVAQTLGGTEVKGAIVAPFNPHRNTTGLGWREVECDLIAVSGGWNPSVHLASQRGALPVFDEAIAAFVPPAMPAGQQHVGACRGGFFAREAAEEGFAAGATAAEACGFIKGPGALPQPEAFADEHWEQPIRPLWDVEPPPAMRAKKRFLDLQHDVSSSDVALAHREGYVSVEHMKRYTTLGMATDQGKIANVTGLAILAGLRGDAIGDVGTTTFRPPYTPVTIGALAADETGPHFKPVRRTAMHACHERAGAVFLDVGVWKRAWYYPEDGEDLNAAYIRETGQVRKTVGMVDVSTLGKIDVQGPDAAEFLNRVYVNGWSKLAVGKARYGVMLREDGIALDDGTTSRMSEHHYFMTTTTAEAAKVMAHLEYLLQTAWPELKVHVTSVTDQWAGVAVAGPKSRALLADVIGDADLSNESLPHMGVREGRVGEIPVRVHRLSFSGELAYEVYTPAGYGEALWDALAEAGKAHGLVFYGTEALGALRVEKGHVAGAEIDGRTTLDDLGLGKMASKAKPFIGKVLSRREALQDPMRPRFVAFMPVDGKSRIRPGSLIHIHQGPHEGHGLGHVSSTTYSPQLGHYVGLGFVAGGTERMGQVVDACYPLKREVVPVRVTTPHFFDPEGERLNG